MVTRFLAVLLAASVVCSQAYAVVLDIDSLPGMANTPGSAVPTSNQLSNQRLNQFVLVSSFGGFGSVVAENGNTGTGWKRNDPSVTAGLGGSTSGGLLDYASALTFRFVDSVDGTTPLFTSSFSVYTDWFGDGSTVSLTGFDVIGNVVAQMSGAEHIGQQNIGTMFSITGSNIHRVVVQGSGTTGFSNVEYAQPVPEPATMAALAIGVASLLRRRRR